MSALIDDAVTATDDATHCWRTCVRGKVAVMKQPDEGNLFTDLMELGPAPTMARELVVIVISVAIIAGMFALAGVSVPTIGAGVAIALFLGYRFVIGRREWQS